ncbi:MAG TPA: macro domain-containing protein, partial [Cytophagales bacterium]|nr:macro domain-containing protein [Cytophagales bacterium]
GEAKLTKGYNLPAKYVIHTVGPVWNNGRSNEEKMLGNCYLNSLNLAVQNQIKTIAFPAISTGVYGYPFEEATEIALSTTIKFLRTNPSLEKIIFVCFNDALFDLYSQKFNSIKNEKAF